MLLGFISLLLNVFQGATKRICVRRSAMDHMLPCPRPLRPDAAKAVAHYGATTVFTGVLGSTRRLLAGGGASSDYCIKKVR
jgi:mlo protein